MQAILDAIEIPDLDIDARRYLQRKLRIHDVLRTNDPKRFTTHGEPEVTLLVNSQRKIFEDFGCVVEEAEPDWTGAHEGYDVLRAWNFVGTQAENVRLHRELVKDTILWEVERGSKLTGAEIAHAHSLRSAAWDRMRTFQEKYELDQRPLHVDVYRMAEILYFDFGAGESRDVDTVWFYAGRPAGGTSDRGEAS